LISNIPLPNKASKVFKQILHRMIAASGKTLNFHIEEDNTAQYSNILGSLWQRQPPLHSSRRRTSLFEK